MSEEHALFVGAALNTSIHAHYAVQLTLALDAPFQLCAGAASNECGAAVVPSREPHAVRSRQGRLLFIYLDPTAPSGQRFAAGGRDRNVRTLRVEEVADCLPDVERYLSAGCGETDAAGLVDRVVAALLPNVESGSRLDPRLRRLLSILEEGGSDPCKLADLAARVSLSPDRLRHLFSEQLGIPLRSYKSWARIRRAIELLARGGSLTEVAHAANFVDAAHLSRTFRDMFGITLSELAKNQIELV